MTASWEGIARALLDAPVSDVELADRLGCKPQLVAQVRADLGQPALPVPAPSAPLTVDERFELLAVVVAGGHVKWRGRTTKDGVPIIDPWTTAQRVAFRRTYGREPEGQVRGWCPVNHCLEGLHLTDRRMREQAREQAKADTEALDACL
ncbi:hypothetical protein ACFVHS_25095 [Streptomyces sp. NPDC057746]|uniref:hypothetical protein n=1 Tax=Streptomyces sp. NPDC057746 TaxID=3346237 RepID=UPI00369519DC